MAQRRFKADLDLIVRDLGLVLSRMGAEAVVIETGARQSQEARRKFAREGWAVEAEAPALFPLGAAIRFRRDGRPYRFACANYAHALDNLRAAQQAVTLLYRIYEEYGVGEGGGEGASFERIFALGAGAVPPAAPSDGDWRAVLGVSAGATKAEIRAAYHDRAKRLHPDVKPGDDEPMAELNVAYERAMREAGA